jgi:hypothetical protein
MNSKREKMATQGSLFEIDNPHINRIYLEHEFGKAGHDNGVLVVETDIPLRELKSGKRNDELDDLLLDLNELQVKAEKKVGHLQRIDIRFR